MLPKNKFVFENRYKTKELNLVMDRQNISRDEREFCDEIEMLIDAEHNVSDGNTERGDNSEKDGNETGKKDTVGISGNLGKNASNAIADGAGNDTNALEDDVCSRVCDDARCKGDLSREDALCRKRIGVAGDARTKIGERSEMFKSIDIKNIFDRRPFAPRFSGLINGNTTKTSIDRASQDDAEKHGNGPDTVRNTGCPVETAGCTVLEKLLLDLSFAYNVMKTDNMQKHHHLDILGRELDMLRTENKRITDVFVAELRRVKDHLISGTDHGPLLKMVADVQTRVYSMENALKTENETAGCREETAGLRDELHRVRSENEKMRHDKQLLEEGLKGKETMDGIRTAIETIGMDLARANENHTVQRNLLLRNMDTRKNLKQVYREKISRVSRVLTVLRAECSSLREPLADAMKLVGGLCKLKNTMFNEQAVRDRDVIARMRNDYESKIRCFQDEIARLKRSRRERRNKPDNSDVWNVFEN